MTEIENGRGRGRLIAYESCVIHAPYSPEIAFYTAVRDGDVKKVAKLCECDFVSKKGFGELSDNPLRNAVYHFIISVALVARYCIDGGMGHEAAYELSDFYIQQADRCTAVPQISQLHDRMATDYVQRMSVLKKNQIFSKPVAECMDYIYANLYTRITLTMLADYVRLNPSYLSRLFKKTTGVTVSFYIRQKKMEEARNLLRFTDDSIAQIASALAFPTQSYFIEVFQKQEGMTPKKYRSLTFRKITSE